MFRLSRRSFRMRFAPPVIATLFALAFVNSLSPKAQAQVVQLPTFRSFGIGTTVNVPDGGSAMLGGISRGGSGTVSRGVPGLSGIPGAGRLFGNRATGSSRSVSMASVHVTIIDLEELDQQVLAEAARRQAARDADARASGATVLESDQRRRADYLDRYMGRNRKAP